MNAPSNAARSAAGILAAIGWIGLIVQLVVSVRGNLANGYPAFAAVTTYFSFFTIWTNLLVSVAFTTIALSPYGSLGSFFGRSGTQAAVTSYATLVSLAYNLLLRHLWNPTGAALLADEILHDVVPVLTIVYWAGFAGKTGLRFVDVPKWMLFPLVYGIFALVRGELIGHYTYAFIDVGELGYTVVARNVVGFVVAFLILGSIYAGIGRLVQSRRPTASS